VKYQQQSNIHKNIPNPTNSSDIFLIVKGVLVNGNNLVIGQNSDIQKLIDLEE
jgi:hypothetical protein